MVPAELNLKVYKGATFETLTLVIKDSDKNIVDLTGWTPYAHVRKDCGQTLVLDLGPEINSPTDGEVEIALTDEETSALSRGNYKWDLLLENGSGEVLGPYVAGNFKVLCPITET